MDEKNDLRSKIIGLGRNSLRKSYYPSLQKKIGELNLFYTVFEHLSDLILIIDTNSGFISYANKSARKIFEINDPAKATIEFDKLVEESFYSKIKNCFINNECTIKGKAIDYEIISREGLTSYEVTVDCIQINEEKIQIVIFRDVTERKKYVAKIARSEADLKETQAIAKIARLEYNYLTKKKEISKNFKNVLCVEDEIMDTEDENIESLMPNIHSDDLDLVKTNFDRALLNYDDFEFSFRSLDKQDSVHYYTTIIKYEFDDAGSPIKMIAVIQDFTQQKINEQLLNEIQVVEETASLKQQFLANMSHEIRTPMTGIIGMIDFLIQTDLSETQYDYVKTIKESSDVLMSIVNDVLNLSKIEAGKFVLTPTVFILQNTIKEIEKLFRIKAESKNLVFKTSCTLDPDIKVYADEIRIKQIISNLISNAIKYTNEGEVSLSLEHNIIENNKIPVKISIKDTGVGIKEEDSEKLFRKFSLIHSNQAAIEQGIGLGLAISKEIAVLMGGDIYFKSKPDVGSEFWFSIQLPVSNLEIISEEFVVPKGIKLNKNVLLAEDKKVNQKVISLMIEYLGCKVTVANNGKEVLEIIETNRAENVLFDFLLLDIQMPVMDGITTLKMLKQKYNKLPTIIGLSANALEGDAERYISEGLDDYLSKPVSKEMLYSKIIKWAK